MSRCASSRWRRGSAAVEFALVGTIFLSVLFAVIDLSRYMASRTALRAATAGAAARWRRDENARK